MHGMVNFVTFDVFVVELGNDLYSIIELPPSPAKKKTLDIYKEPDVQVFDEIQGNLLTEGPVELLNVTRNKKLNVVIRKSYATKYDVAKVL